MTNRILYIISVSVISLLLINCKAKKPLITDLDLSEKISKKKADTIVNQVLANNFEFVDLKAKIKTKFKSREQRNAMFGTFIKMKKDSSIHATISVLTVPLIVALITPDSIKFINKTEKKYFAGNFDYVQQLIKTDITFYEIQDLLVGNPIRLDSSENHYLIEEKNEVFVSSISQKKINQLKNANKKSGEWLIKFWVNELYKMGKTVIQNDSSATEITISQENFNKEEGQYFPNKTQIEVVTPKDSISIQLNYQRVKINSDIEFDFVIPSHYTPYIEN